MLLQIVIKIAFIICVYFATFKDAQWASNLVIFYVWLSLCASTLFLMLKNNFDKKQLTVKNLIPLKITSLINSLIIITLVAFNFWISGIVLFLHTMFIISIFKKIEESEGNG